MCLIGVHLMAMCLMGVHLTSLHKSDEAKRPCFRYIDVDGVIDKHGNSFNCSVPDCKRTQGFASLISLRRHETETHGMHNTGQKLLRPIPTCGRHNGKGFQRNEQVENHIRRKHPNNGDNLGRCLKRKASVDRAVGFLSDSCRK
jgi:hypothetical protein